jgi:pyridoxal phosphate phosphatase PHOSPHO2
MTPPVEFKILSDANTEYIQLINSANEISSCFTETITNYAHWDEQGRLHIKAYQDENEPHQCKHCPVNLCKGKELKKMLARKKFEHVIYIGDGHGDYCPCLHLQSSDAILARKDWALHKTINSSTEPVNAPVFTWESGVDMSQHIQRLVASFSVRQNQE